MKRTLALLIAVLMVVAMLPLSTLAATAQTAVGAPAPQTTPAPEQNATGKPQTPPAPTSSDYFALYDADGNWVSYYATLAEADAAIKDGYTLKVLQSYTADATHVWGEGRGEKGAPIRYTVDGALAEGGNAVITVNGASVAFGWMFNELSAGDQITVKNITMIAAQGAVFATVGENDTQINLTLENCKLYAGNSYYEVEPGAYAAAPATNAYNALSVKGVALRVLGDQTVMRATAGIAFQATDAEVYVENGYFYSSAAEKTVAMKNSALVVMNASVVNDAQTALYLLETDAYIHGGAFAVTKKDANAPAGAIGAIHVDTVASLVLTGGRVAAAEGLYAIATQNGGTALVFGGELAMGEKAAMVYGDVNNSFTFAAYVNAEVAVPVVGEGTVAAPAHTVATKWQCTLSLKASADNLLEIYDAADKLIAYLPASAMASLTAEVLEVCIAFVPNGGKLLVKTAEILVNDTLEICPNFPKMAITIEGVGKTPVAVHGAVDGYLLTMCNSMDVTLKNITFENTLGKGVKLGSDENAALIAKDATLVLGMSSALICKMGEVAYVATGSTLKLEDGGSVYSMALAVGENAAVVLEGGAALELNGGILNAAPAAGASAILSKTVTRSAAITIDTETVEYSFTLSKSTVRLNAGEVVLPGEITSLHQIADTAVTSDMTISSFVALKYGDRDNLTEFKNIAKPVELLDKEGNRVGLYGSIAEALAQLQAIVAQIERTSADMGVALIEVTKGYTVKLLADHVETALFRTEFEELVWTLNGDNKTLYIPEVNYYGMEFAGKNTIAKVENLTLCTGGNGLTVNAPNNTAGVGVIANNVIVYAAGSTAKNREAYVGNIEKIAAFRVTNPGGELILLGDRSAAYYNAQGLAGTYLLHNCGSMAIYGGTYEAPVSYVVDSDRATYTYLAGGTFIGGESNVHTVYNHASGVVAITGGSFVTKNGNALQASSGSITVFGGSFYHLSDDAFGAWTSATNVVQYWGGSFFTVKGADADKNFVYNVQLKAETAVTKAQDYTTTAQDKGVTAGLAMVKESVVYSSEWLSANGYTEGDYTFKVYSGVGTDFFGVYGPSFRLATEAVGPYNGKIELQKDVDIIHTTYVGSRQFGPIADITLTSAPDHRYTYASSNYSGSGTGSQYFMWLNGGNWTFENIKLANYGSQLLQVNTNNLSRVTVIVGEMGELSGHTSGVLLANSDTRLIVKEGGYVNASANQNVLASATVRDHLAASSNLVRLTGSSDVYVAGHLGYYPPDADHTEPYLPTSGGFRCINFNSGAEALAGTGEQCIVYLAPSAKLGTPVGSRSLSVINISISDYTVAHDVLVEAAATVVDGKTVAPSFATDGCVVNATSGTQVKMDSVTIQNTVPALDGSFSASDYAFLMSAAGGEFKNIKYYGSKFMNVESRGVAKNEAMTIVFDGDNEIITKSSAVLWNIAASCNTDIVINDGYYQSEAGNFTSAAAEAVDAAPSEGKLIINGGTFYKDNGNNYSMFLSYGSYDIEVNDGFFHIAYNALMFGMSSTSGKAVCTTELTINGGEFEIWYGWLYSDESATNETKLTINDCHVMAESGVDYSGTERTATGILRVGGKCQATINGGTFETEEFATNKTCDILQTRHSATVTVNDWTVYHRSGNESAVRILGDNTVVINGGWIESNGRFVVRTMGGSNSATALKTPSKAILYVYGGTMILNPCHPKLNNSTSNCVIGNGGSEQFGHIYVYGGQFINKNDAEPLTPSGSYSRQVLGRINIFGDFYIYGGIMIAGSTQDFFYNSDPNNGIAGAGASVPSVDIPIVKGVTPKYVEEDGREFYYTVYGAGDSLLVPEIQTNTEATVTGSASGLVFTAAMDAIHYDALITWARSHAYVYNNDADSYELAYGMLITTAADLQKTFGVVSVEALQKVGGVCLDKRAAAADAKPNADGSLDISATVENISKENKTVQYLAIPYVEITVGIGTAATVTERYYGEYNSSAGVASMSSVAATILRDNTDVKTGEYKYASLMMPGAFNRYSEEQQTVLKTYLVHEHSFDYKGVCQDEDCGAATAVVLGENVAEQIFAESGFVKFYQLQLSKDVVYSFGFTKDILSYTLYDAKGAVCKVSGGLYTAAADGTYYLRVDGKKSGSTQLIVSHIHTTDHLGMCEVCEQSIAIDIQTEQAFEGVFVKGNYYVFRVNLVKGVTYNVSLVNGEVVLYDAQGEAKEMISNSFTCEADGVYYIKVKATYTAKGSIGVAHEHSYNSKGVCGVCAVDAGRPINNIYEYTTSVRMQEGDKAFFHIYMEAGRTYSLVYNQHFGVYNIFNAADEMMTLGANGFECEVSGIYYLVLDIQNDVALQLRIDATHGETCTYNNKGECEFIHTNIKGEPQTVSCGKTARKQLLDGKNENFFVEAGKKEYFYFNYAGAGISYKIELPVGVRYMLCDADGNVIKLGVNAEELLSYTQGVSADGKTTADIYTDTDTDRILYIVVEADAATEGVLRVSHVHEINHRGMCTVKDTTQNASCSVRNGKMISVDTAEKVTFVAGGTYYYEVSLKANSEYRVMLGTGIQATWKLVDAEGNLVRTSEDEGAYVPALSGYYYLVVTATADSVADDAMKPATLTVSEHTHKWSNKGACACGEQKPGFVIDLDELAKAGGLRVGQLKAGTYHLKATMTAGKSYTLKASVSLGSATYVLYGGADATTEMTVTNDTFACTESGVYYYVLTVTQTTAAFDTVAYTITPDLPVAHVHSFSAPYHYVKDGDSYYQVVDKCDLESCNVSKRVPVSTLAVNTALVVDYKARETRYYALSLVAGTSYEFAFVNSDATWKLVLADGTVVATNEGGDFDCLESGVYYLEVTPKIDSFEKHGVKPTITAISHVLNVKGECTDENCTHVTQIGNMDTLIAAGGLQTGSMLVGVYHYTATLTAGKTYTLAFSAKDVTYKLYNAEGVEQTVTDGAFTCAADGTYYYVVSIPAVTAEDDTMGITVAGELPFAHVHSYTKPYHYEYDAESGKYYHVTPCDGKDGETLCPVDKRVERTVTVLAVNTPATKLTFAKGSVYYYQLTLEAGTDYIVSYADTTLTWKLLKADGTVAVAEAVNVIRGLEAGEYYLEVTAGQANDANASLLVSAHHFGNTGVCTDDGCTFSVQEQVADLVEIGGLWIGTLAKGTYFFHAEMEAGKTYTLKFDTATLVSSYVLYNAAGEVQEVTENAFACTVAGDYYYVVTVVEDPTPEEEKPVWDRISVTITPDVLTEENLHNFVGAYYYLSKDGKHYMVVPCKEDGCKAEKHIEIGEIVIDEITDAIYKQGDVLHHALTLAENTYYVITFLGADVKWVLYSADGQQVADHTVGTFDCAVSGVYYMVIEANADSAADATVLVDPVHHCESDDCTDPNCPHKRVCSDLGELLASGGIASAAMDAGTYYFFLNMEAGKTYTLAFSNAGVTYQLFSTVNGKQTVTDNAYECLESGLYYYVVTIPEGTTGRDTFRISAAD